jgi:hypothetical protein
MRNHFSRSVSWQEWIWFLFAAPICLAVAMNAAGAPTTPKIFWRSQCTSDSGSQCGSCMTSMENNGATPPVLMCYANQCEARNLFFQTCSMSTSDRDSCVQTTPGNTSCLGCKYWSCGAATMNPVTGNWECSATACGPNCPTTGGTNANQAWNPFLCTGGG